MAAHVGDVHTFFGKGAEFQGKLTFDGSVRIDGKFSGEIYTTDTLVIGEGATVQAEISAGTVIINGSVEGTVKTTGSIELHHTGRARGTFETPSLSIEKGCFFEGSCKMEKGTPRIESASTLGPQLPVELMAANAEKLKAESGKKR
jgi:cytoskeletal protein CcmA (bactofilin family)